MTCWRAQAQPQLPHPELELELELELAPEGAASTALQWASEQARQGHSNHGSHGGRSASGHAAVDAGPSMAVSSGRGPARMAGNHRYQSSHLHHSSAPSSGSRVLPARATATAAPEVPLRDYYERWLVQTEYVPTAAHAGSGSGNGNGNGNSSSSSSSSNIREDGNRQDHEDHRADSHDHVHGVRTLTRDADRDSLDGMCCVCMERPAMGSADQGTYRAGDGGDSQADPAVSAPRHCVHIHAPCHPHASVCVQHDTSKLGAQALTAQLPCGNGVQWVG